MDDYHKFLYILRSIDVSLELDASRAPIIDHTCPAKRHCLKDSDKEIFSSYAMIALIRV